MTATLLLALACAPAPPPEAPDVDLRPGRGQRVEHLLDQLDRAALDLHPDNLPPGADAPVVHRLDSGWSTAPWGDGSVWEHPSPVLLAQKRHSVQPPGLELRAGGRALQFDPRVLAPEDLPQRWVLFKDKLYLVSRLQPARWPDPPELVLAPAAQREGHLNLARSGQAPQDFARRSVTIGPLTRPCLYLPAPSSAALPVAVPAGGGTLRWAVGMVPTGDEGAAGEARLDLLIDGQLVTSSFARTGPGWESAQLDLSPWGGRQVQLAFRTDPLGDPTRDYLCVADPVLEHPAPEAADPVRVVLIGLDTLRRDHLSFYGHDRPTSPHLDALAAQSVVFNSAWTPAPRTRPSFRTSTTGRWPLRAIGAPTLGEQLGAAGLATAGIVANVHLVPRLGFAEGYDWWHYDNGASAGRQVDRALEWLGAHAHQDSFLFLHLMDPHTFYLAPEPWTDRFTEGLDRGDLPDRYNRWMVEQWQEGGQLSPDQRAFIEGRYDGEIGYMDQELGRLFTALDAMPGRTLVVVHTDHGEEFWDHGGFEHNHTLYDELTRAVLWFRPPGGVTGGPVRVTAPTSLADIAPTLVEAIGAAAPATDGTSLWPLVDGGEQSRRPALEAALSDRPLPIGHLMFDTERWAVVAADPQGVLHKYLLQTASGAEELYELQADPGEQRDLSAERDLAPWRQALARATEWPVGDGWRLHLERVSRPLLLRFAAPVDHAAVMDPEAAATRRANLEWGEVPALVPADVGTIELSADRRQLSYTPGRAGSGTLLVVGGGEGATLVEAERERPLAVGPNPAGGGHLDLRPGPVIIPLESEVEALTGGRGSGEVEGDQLQALRELGYVE